MVIESVKGGTVFVVAGNVGGDVLELLDLCSDLWIVVGILEVGSSTFVELCLVHLCACVANDLDISGKEVLGVEAKESRERLRI